MTNQRFSLHGWLILDKPLGLSSAQAVGAVKRILRPAKIGHAGTLDPLASGILPLALGEATKTVGYMMDAEKSYDFTVCWGEERTTDDREGEVVQSSDRRPLLAEIEALLPEFQGVIEQAPPSFSAIKVNGERAYKMAREGEAVQLAVRQVRVDSLTILDQIDSNHTSFRLACGKGTYVRSLARDMGRRLGCFGHVAVLRRTRVGNFDENAAISLDNLEKLVHSAALLPVESALDDIPAFDADSAQAASLRRGQAIFCPSMKGEVVSVMHEGKLLALASVAGEWLKPVRVFNY